MAYWAAFDATVEWSVADRLHELDIPVLVVAASRDYAPLAWKRALVDWLREGRLDVVEVSGHATPVERPDPFNRLLQEFTGSGTLTLSEINVRAPCANGMSERIVERERLMNDDRQVGSQKLEARFEQWRTKLDELVPRVVEARAAAPADARIEFQRQVEFLRDKQDAARRKLDELDQSHGEASKRLEGEAEQALNELVEAVTTAWERFE